jgi:hypothetical protein
MANNTLITTIITASCLCACSSRSELSEAIEGTWSGIPTRIDDNDIGYASYVPIFTFTTDSTARGGDIAINALISISGPIDSDSILANANVSVSGRASISGSWSFDGRNHIIVSLNSTTLEVSVDPDAVVVMIDSMGNSAPPVVDTLSTQLTTQFRQRMEKDMGNQLLTLHKLNSVKIRSDILTFRIDNRKYALTRKAMPL